jgi:hypothetical protein
MNRYTENEIEQLMAESSKRSHDGRLRRLRVLLSNQAQSAFPSPALALEYYEEARLCWYVGAFIAAIVMTQLAFEELLRGHYRVANGVGGTLSCGKKVDEAGFFDLINEAKKEEYISQDEATLLHALRQKLRNPYVHVKDADKVENDMVEKTNFLSLLWKVASGAVEDEARKAVILLVQLFPEISLRHGGL